jgi:hypothetical protein
MYKGEKDRPVPLLRPQGKGREQIPRRSSRPAFGFGGESVKQGWSAFGPKPSPLSNEPQSTATRMQPTHTPRIPVEAERGNEGYRSWGSL